jgi:uncharacterized membrane protein YeaQ/YmgE (transglycosylase-associated protein family)
MNFLLWIVFGGLVGWVASLVMRTDAQQGILINVIVGIVGASIGGWIMGMASMGGMSGFNLYSFAVATLGAIVLIAVVQAVRHA